MTDNKPRRLTVLDDPLKDVDFDEVHKQALRQKLLDWYESKMGIPSTMPVGIISTRYYAHGLDEI